VCSQAELLRLVPGVEVTRFSFKAVSAFLSSLSASRANIWG
jgi:hypothetical protein